MQYVIMYVIQNLNALIIVGIDNLVVKGS